MIINGNVCKNGNRIYGVVGGDSPVQGNVNKAENIYVKQVEFNNRFEFPSIGKPNIIYIATDEKASYIFDTAQNVYHCIGRDSNEIDSIKCQLKEE